MLINIIIIQEVPVIQNASAPMQIATYQAIRMLRINPRTFTTLAHRKPVTSRISRPNGLITTQNKRYFSQPGCESQSLLGRLKLLIPTLFLSHDKRRRAWGLEPQKLMQQATKFFNDNQPINGNLTLSQMSLVTPTVDEIPLYVEAGNILYASRYDHEARMVWRQMLKVTPLPHQTQLYKDVGDLFYKDGLTEEATKFGVLAPKVEIKSANSNQILSSTIHRPKTKAVKLKGFKAIVGKIPPQVLECVEMLKDMDAYEKMGSTLPRGLLMVGPPGTGKTRIAQAIAEESGAEFFNTNITEFTNKHFGESEKKVRQVFNNLKNCGKSAILFIDELDAVGSRNSDSSDISPTKCILPELLIQMDGLDTAKKRNDFIVIGATNCANSVDPALKRPGRFDQIIEVPLPDLESRYEIIKFYLSFVRHDTSSITDDVIKEAAVETEGCSPADIKYIINEASILAVKQRADAVNINHVLEAYVRHQNRNENASQSLKQHGVFKQPKVNSDVVSLQPPLIS